VMIVTAPVVTNVCLTLWHTPFPVSEAVAIFEDIANRPAASFLTPDTPYYRPLFHLTLSAFWHRAGSLDATLALVKLLQIVPVVVLVLAFIWNLRPRAPLEAIACSVAMAVLIGSPGFRDNIEIPLSYTTVGMPIALIVWTLVNREPRPWHGPVIVVLASIAIGFKEQGLVIVPLVLIAWWTRAPGATRTIAASLTILCIGYLALRASGGSSWRPFEQAIGLGFREIEPDEAIARFGAFPYGVYAYNGAATIANVLFSEPTRGTFSIVHSVMAGDPAAWQLIRFGSSAALTCLIGWWGIGALRSTGRNHWTSESRTFLALLVVLLACGVLSFNYSRDRLGGMATVFYATAAFFAVRAAADRLLTAPRMQFAIGTVALALLAGAWQTRVVATIELARLTSVVNQKEWLVALPQRRKEFGHRAVYLEIMNAMIEQGTRPGLPRPTRYPACVVRALGVQ
jgi:hypothetical protein